MSNETAVYGYVRVSTEKQNNEHWKLMIRDYCDGKNLSEPWFREETVSGAKPWKERKLAAVLTDMKPREHLVVGEASRIGRDAADALDFIKAARNAGIIVHVIQAGLEVNGDGVDAATIILPVLFGMAEYERKLLSYRTKLGLQRAKESGKILGGTVREPDEIPVMGPALTKLRSYVP
jgi:DNA invertase Pin-like site-specific DNA recombinase